MVRDRDVHRPPSGSARRKRRRKFSPSTARSARRRIAAPAERLDEVRESPRGPRGPRSPRRPASRRGEQRVRRRHPVERAHELAREVGAEPDVLDRPSARRHGRCGRRRGRAWARFASTASGCSMIPMTPPLSRKRAQRVVGEVARVVVDRAARGVADDDRRVRHALEDVPVRLLQAWARSRIMPSSTHRSTSCRPSSLRPPAPVSAAPSANGFRRFHVSDIIRTPSSHIDLGDPRVVAERLGALEREHQPDALAALHGGRGRRAAGPRRRVSAFSRTARWKAAICAEPLAQAALRQERKIDEHRADLQRDAAGLEVREPVRRERDSPPRACATGTRARAAGRCGRRRSAGTALLDSLSRSVETTDLGRSIADRGASRYAHAVFGGARSLQGRATSTPCVIGSTRGGSRCCGNVLSRSAALVPSSL